MMIHNQLVLVHSLIFRLLRLDAVRMDLQAAADPPNTASTQTLHSISQNNRIMILKYLLSCLLIMRLEWLLLL